MVRTSRRHSSLQITLTDYIVPIIGGLILLVLLYSFFKGDTTPPVTDTSENKTPTSLSFGVPETEAYVMYPDDVKEKVSESTLLYKGQTVVVKLGSLKLVNPDESTIHLNKVGELTYNVDGSYELLSSDAWFSTTSATTISMRYANLEIPKNSVVSLTQNEAGSTIYVLAGSVKVSNIAGVSTSLVKGQKISVSRINAANKDVDLSAEKGVIDSYFKGSDWFIDNQGHLVLEQEDESKNTVNGNSGTVLSSTGNYVNFENLRDEMSIEGSTLNIRGTFKAEDVGAISINNTPVTLNSSGNSFRLDGVSLGNTMNDIVVKIYSSDREILEKSVFTVYTSTPLKNTSSSTNSLTSSPTAPTSLEGTSDANPKDFGFTEPAANGSFTTTSGEITIRGYTNSENITAVEVNGFPLASFNGSTWRYHAFERFETLEEGTNQYKVDYLNEAGKIVYSDYYTIIKKQATTSSPSSPVIQKEDTPTSSSSGEPSLFSE